MQTGTNGVQEYQTQLFIVKKALALDPFSADAEEHERRFSTQSAWIRSR